MDGITNSRDRNTAVQDAPKRDRIETVGDVAQLAAPSVAGRALLALLLLVGFYVLTLVVIGALLFVVWLEVKVDYYNLYVTLLCLFGALGLLIALFPRSVEFVEPGPRLTRQEQPRLFALLDAVGRELKVASPAEVYLDPEPNAWVTQRGGILGLFSRRVMGIGLPLLSSLSVSELRAIVAHEFGHYTGGDTALGPWLYHTRLAIANAIAMTEAQSSIINAPFELYGELFLTLTQSVSREQELAADRVACRVGGPRAFASALRAIVATSLMYPEYWERQIVPLVDAGFRPPIGEGFARYFATSTTSSALAERIALDLDRQEPDPHDSHPPNRDRIALANRLPPEEPPSDDPPALTLIDDPGRLEAALVKGPSDRTNALQPVEWDEVGTRVYEPVWENLIRTHAAALSGLTLFSLPTAATNLLGLADKLKLSLAYRDKAERDAADILAIAVTTALIRQGWVPESSPGQPPRCRRNGTQIEPRAIIQQLASGELKGNGWGQLCASLGIANAPLAPQAS